MVRAMRASLSIVILSSSLLAACSSDPAPADAPGSNVETVTCAGGEMSIATTGDSFAGVYTPNAVTISAGQAVQFVMPATHNVVPDTGGDANLSVPFSTTRCLKFKVAGSYKFHCGPHAFKGTVTVQ